MRTRGVTGGSFKLSYGGASTTSIAHDASAEAVAAVLHEVDAVARHSTRQTERLVSECVARLRASGDGGEADLDQTLEPGVRIVPIKDAALHGSPEWVLPAPDDPRQPPPSAAGRARCR